MSIELNRAAMPKELKQKIVEDLMLFPEEESFSKSKRKFVKPPERFAFFVSEGDRVYLPINYALNFFKIQIVKQYQPYPFNFTGKLRPEQVPVAAETIKYLAVTGGCTLAVRTGFGKTIIGAYAASCCRLITAILVTREILCAQWKSTFNNNTDAIVWIVGEPLPEKLPQIIICMDGRTDSIPEELRKLVGFLIIDEAHMFCTKGRVKALLAFQPRYVLAETATLERDDKLHKMIHFIAGTATILRDFDTNFIVCKILTRVQGERKNNSMGVNYGHLLKTTLENPNRNKLILYLVSKYCSRKILILTSLVEHSKLLTEMIKAIGISCDFLSGTKSSYQDAQVLVGTIPKIGTGFDPATSCDTYDGRPFDTLILVSSIKKYQALTQNVGRVFRSQNPIIFHFVDEDNIFENHWRKCLSWYKSRGGTISEVDLAAQLGLL